MLRLLTSWWTKKEDDDLDEIMKEYYSLSAKKTDEVENFVGCVTQVSARAIELDGTYYAPLSADDHFSVGDKVSFTVRPTETGVEIKDVKLVTDGVGLVKHMNVRITDISEGVVYLNFGLLKYDLSVFQKSMSHRIGDKMKVKCECVNEEDYGHAVVLEVAHENTKVYTGKVTEINLDEQYGVVDGQVYFDLKDASFVAKIRDAVTCSCVSSQQKNFRWRAATVLRNTSTAPRGGAALEFSVVERFVLAKGESKTVTFFATNNTPRSFSLGTVSIEPQVPNVSFLRSESVDVILPHASASFSFACTGDRPGKLKLVIKWMFSKNLIVRRTLQFETVRVSATNRDTTQRVTMPAKRNVRGPRFVKFDLKPYNVPQNLKDICGKREETFLDKLVALQNQLPCLATPLSEDNYGAIMHALLFLEEIAVDEIIGGLETVSTFGVFQDHHTFSFPADSDYSKICAGDTLFASKPWEKNVRYAARVYQTSKTSMVVKFHPDFNGAFKEGAQYSVTFVTSRMQMRRRHQAVDLVLEKLGSDWLFPNGNLRNATRINSLLELTWYNPVLNPEQKTAIRQICLKNNLPFPYVIYGPPGTGKTLTLVELILQIYTAEANSRILVTAPTNSAVDTLAIQLFQFGVIHRSDCVRLSSYNVYVQGGIAADLMDISFVPVNLEGPSEGDPVPNCDKDELYRFKVVLGTLTTIGVLNNMKLPAGFFTHIIVDEASQTCEPDTLIPVALAQKPGTQLVFAGDPKQLGPVVQSKLASEYFFHKSLLQRFIETAHPYRKDTARFCDSLGYDPGLIKKLVRNYRALPSIVRLYSELFYDNELIPIAKENTQFKEISLLGRSLKESANIFIHTDGVEEQQDESSSWFNKGEIVQVIRVVSELTNSGVSPDDIGIITPYHLQARKIFDAMEQLNCFVPKVGSVEEFQGQERNVIVVSLVRCCSQTNKGLPAFIVDERRVNVALSRARLLNVIIGHKPSLKRHPLWAQILTHCECL